jgi:hypothetical protein
VPPLRNYNGDISGSTHRHTWFPALVALFGGRGHILGGLRFCLAIAALCGAVSGCTTTPPPIAPTPVAAPTLPVSVNGTYNGVMQLVQGLPTSCGTDNMFTLSVTNNAFSYTLNQPQVPGQPTRVFNVVIASNGSFQTAPGAVFMRGTASGTHIAGDIVGDACGYHFDADSSGTW